MNHQKIVLCYGDSNTWGQIPLRDFVKARYERSIRWPGVVETMSQGSIRVIEEGNNGRTTGVDDPFREGRNGATYLSACLDSAVPLDLVIFMLGVNDLKIKYSPDPTAITDRLQKLIHTTKQICSQPPCKDVQVLVIAPVIIKPEHYPLDDFAYPEAKIYSRQLVEKFEQLAEQEKVHFLDASLHIEVGDEDGVHFNEQEHRKLGFAVWNRVAEILNLRF